MKVELDMSDLQQYDEDLGSEIREAVSAAIKELVRATVKKAWDKEEKRIFTEISLGLEKATAMDGVIVIPPIKFSSRG